MAQDLGDPLLDLINLPTALQQMRNEEVLVNNFRSRRQKRAMKGEKTNRGREAGREGATERVRQHHSFIPSISQNTRLTAA